MSSLFNKISSETVNSSEYFFNFLTARASSATTSVIMITLMLTAMLHIPLSDNYLIERKYVPIQYILTYSYLGLNLIANLVIFIAVGTKNINQLRWGLIVATFCFIYWLLLSTLSYIAIHDLFRFVCFENHCPEIHWLFNTKWRDYGIKCPFTMTYPNGSSSTEKNDAVVVRVGADIRNARQVKLKSQYTGCESYTSGPMAISTVLGLFWLLFAVYSFKTTKTLIVTLTREQQSSE